MNFFTRRVPGFKSAVSGLLRIAAAVVVGSTAVIAQKAPVDPAHVTFTKDVAPILYRSCVRCHRPDEIAPMSLLTYADARPWAQAMKMRVSKREMPPWFLDKTIGIQKYKNDPSLSDDEIATIVKWVDGGAPQGNPADMPPMPKLEDVSAWRIGKPDLIVPYPAFSQHLALHGSMLDLRNRGPLLVPDILETGPISVLLGPPPSTVTPSRNDLFRLPQYRGAPRKPVTGPVVVFGR